MRAQQVDHEPADTVGATPVILHLNSMSGVHSCICLLLQLLSVAPQERMRMWRASYASTWRASGPLAAASRSSAVKRCLAKEVSTSSNASCRVLTLKRCHRPRCLLPRLGAAAGELL